MDATGDAGATHMVPKLYIGNYQSNDVSAFTIEADGALTPTPGSPFSTGPDSAPFGMAVSPDAKRLYVSNSGTDSLAVFAIADDGALIPVGDPVPTGGEPWGVAVGPDGHHVYTANIKSNNLTVYAIADDGTLAPVPGSPFATGLGARSVVPSPDGKYVYVTNTGPLGPAGNDCMLACPPANTVSAYAVRADGALKELGGSPFPAGVGAHGASITPDGRHFYVANLLEGSVSGYTVGGDGALTPMPNSPYQITGHSTAITPNGSYLYVSDPSGSVSGFAVASDGTLTQVAGSPYPTLGDSDTTFGVAVTPDGRYLYVNNYKQSGASGIAAFSIASDGSLTSISGSPFKAGTGSIAIVITPGRPRK
jgi:DNA-binding beta-propeller fold protein YncE